MTDLSKLNPEISDSDQLQTIIEILADIRNQNTHLNEMFEEAFRTGLIQGDIDGDD